jgi:RHS repeat-associated protein
VPIVTTDASGASITPAGHAMAGFPGQTRTLSDLYYNRYRDYDSSTGRYIQADPIGLEGGANPYLYARANPLRYTDPLGLESPTLVLDQLATLQEQGKYDGQAAGGLLDFLDNYYDLLTNNWKGQDKYFHCKANCQAAKRGPGGCDFAHRFSNLREVSDHYIKGYPRLDSLQDQAANRHGREHSGEGPCEKVCHRFRPKGLPRGL